ncbi:type-F conjugative transfer system protein TraW [Vibrio lentus]|uniref:type-F conjugative transfer system protein TraW n=1 Tax=Vibrio lentus TaxID=136468 RepID=UPI000C814935|nr:type-F conjugative transfer system protein TraW [Vibrio lentus]PMM38682.1 type-F conjugative transfer system protein TraW [Vibrio lentus]
MKRSFYRLWWLVLLSPFVAAKDLGVMGQTFEVAEVDMMVWIEQRLAQKKADGSIDRFHEQLKATVTGYMAQPPAVQGIQRATRDRSFTVDPTLFVPRDITDHEGNVIVKAGTRVNPFEQLGRPYTRKLAFFDGRDASQLQWVKRMAKQHPMDTTLILVGGNIELAYQKLDQKVWFDQNGYLSQKLHITRVPALAYASGNQWRVDEIKVEDK